LEEQALSVLRLVRGGLGRMPSAFGWGLVALDLHLAARRELAVLGPPDSGVARAALRRWDPTAVVAFGPADDVPLLAGKTLAGGVIPRPARPLGPAGPPAPVAGRAPVAGPRTGPGRPPCPWRARGGPPPGPAGRGGARRAGGGAQASGRGQGGERAADEPTGA